MIRTRATPLIMMFALIASAALAISPAAHGGQGPASVVLGEGAQRYRWLSGWLHVPGGVDLGNTHGSIVSDSRGRIFFNTDTEQAIQVYTPDGEFLYSFGADLKGGVHSLCIVQEKDGEFLYLVHHARGLWRKMTLDGEVLLERGAPEASGLYGKPDQFHPTSIAVVPDGDIFVADGYGLSWVHQYDHAGTYIRSFGGPGSEPGKMQCPHGLLIDKRTQPYTLLVADRENHRIQVFDLQGQLVSIITGMFRRPCSVQEHDGYLAVPDLAGRVTILDRKNELVEQLGDNPDESQRAENGVARENWRDGVFIAPHSAHWDRKGDLYVMDWNYLGRINKLLRLHDPETGAQDAGYRDTPFLPGGTWRVHDADRPNPRVVTPAELGAPPSDAIVLFDGKNLSAWKSDAGPAGWTIEAGAMQVNGQGSIESREHFGDCQLHLEWAAPAKIEGAGQGRGNSGVFLMGRYEVQVLDSQGNRTYADGQAAALYGQTPPAVNACRAPGEWQTYDIVFRAPRFANEKLVSPALVTVMHNGVVVHHATPFLGATAHKQVAEYTPHAAEGPIVLQDHGNPVRYRNIWVRRM